MATVENDVPHQKKENPDTKNLQDESDSKQAEEATGVPSPEKKSGKLKRFWQSCLHKKKISIPVAVLLLVAILAAIPFTRYALAGLVIKKDVTLSVTDETTGKAVSNAKIAVANTTATTDNEGQARLRLKPGNKTVQISKKYYRDSSQKILVPLGTPRKAFQTKLTATGRQVPVMVTNKVTGKPVENAVVKVTDSEVKTDKDGKATLVVPADKAKLDGTVSGDGFNDTKITLTVSESAEQDNSYSLVPRGTLYFLSKKSGKIDVVKTDLDGSNRQTVVAGTGKEEDRGTVLLATRDWKYLALLARRDSDKPKLYLVNTSSDKLSVMDEGDITLNLYGWNNHDFTYTVNRNAFKAWEPKRQAIKVFHADLGQLSTVEESRAEGDAVESVNEELGVVGLLNDSVLYTRRWQTSNYFYKARLANKTANILTTDYNGKSKKDLRSFPPETSIWGKQYNVNEFYFNYNLDNQDNYLEFEDGVIKAAPADAKNTFNEPYPTYLLSPGGGYTLWSEVRDGKNTLFVGDKNGENGKVLDPTSKYSPFGWYSDDYILVSNESSELYLAAREPSGPPAYLKVTDYHKPSLSFRNYGGGYGGL